MPKDALDTQCLTADAAGLERAAALLRGGGLVAFPTETVYGLGADARSEAAAARVFDAKGRPRFNPLIAHIPDLKAAMALADLPEAALRLAAAFWPGPLTLVAPRRPGPGEVADLVAAGLETVALRVPAHPAALGLLRAFGGPLAGPSANPSGKLSPTRAEHVLGGLSGRIEAVIDGGPCPVGVESTIVAVAPDGAARLLRPGGAPVEALEEALGAALIRMDGAAGAGPIAPGMLESHYAPGALLRLGADRPGVGEGWLGFGPDPADLGEGPAANLSPEGDLIAAAAALFAALRRLDTAMDGQGVIAVAPIPERGLGLAINDRLRRAAAPRAPS